MKTVQFILASLAKLQVHNARHLFGILSLLFFTFYQDVYSQSVARINNSGTNDWNFHNSISDNLGNIYYCTRDVNNSTLNVTCMSKELLVVWSYNYNVSGIEPISGMTYKDGRLYITTEISGSELILILDLSGNVLFSKQAITGYTTFASTVMHNNDILVTTSYNRNDGSVQIMRLTPGFVTVFNKKIEFANRDFVYIDHIKQIGNRIIFGGSARTRDGLIGRWVVGALELNGALAYLHEYEVANSDVNPNNHSVAMDSIGPNLMVDVGYTLDIDASGLVQDHIDGVLLKINTTDGSIVDHLVLSPQKDQDWMFFLGVKYQANNKIRVVGSYGVNRDFDNRGLLYGEVDLDFKNFKFKFSNTVSGNTMLTQFIDYDHAAGRLTGQPVLMTVQGMGLCKSNNECFKEGSVISLNKDIYPVLNSYTIVDITTDIVDLTIQRKPIQSTLVASCGVSTCEENHEIQICRQHYSFDYSSIRQNPSKLTNLTLGIANMTHDAINKMIILDPIKSGTAMILMETQINIFLKQLDTFKFFILNDSLPVLDLGPDKVLCNGDSAILGNFGLDSIHWSDGSIGKSITVKKAGVYYGSYSNKCGSVADTITITTQQFPKLNIGKDILICGDQPGTLSSNYDNTVWSNGDRGRNIFVNTAGRIIGFVSTPCGLSFDTVEVYKFDRSYFSAGKDQEICDPLTVLTGNLTNPYPNLFSTDIEWKQIDQLPPVLFSDEKVLNPTVSNLAKDKDHFFELNIKLGNSCILKDTVRVFSKTCFIDSCAFIIQKNCLPNGMVELKAIDANSNAIVPKVRINELFWDIKDGPAGRGYSIVEKNPVVVSNYTRFSLTYKLYTWPKGKPHTIEFAEICQTRSSDSLTLACTGPCENFSFILSSCLDDYDEDNNLNYPAGFCKSVCINNCDYIVGIFDLNGEMIDPNFYTVKWSTGETGAISRQKGCVNYNLTVEVRRGDCVWYGRYRPSCIHHNGGFTNDQNGMKRSGPTGIDEQSLEVLLNSNQNLNIYSSTGQYLGKDASLLKKLIPGLYFIETMDNGQRMVNKFFISAMTHDK